MVFTSNVFLFLFLPLFLGSYYLTPDRYRSWTILGGSYLFYSWWRMDFVLLFMAVTVWNYLIGQAMAHVARIPSPGSGKTLPSRPQDSPAARRLLIAGVGVDLLVLAYFKYANFGVASFNQLGAALGWSPLSMGRVILPIGISFYIFQAISYLVDVWRGDTRPTRRFIDFASFIALFPQLIAGPILRYKDLAGQLSQRTHSWEKFSQGASRFMQGFAKKIIIADSIAPLADHCFSLAHPSMADSWTGVLAYTAQLYFDFSGYSDMAIGLGLMMGFTFVENFHFPYISQSISEFWRRWHISLSVWLRDYLYIPLGGNRGGLAKTMRNLLVTMLLGGLWHGANWTFLLWGGWHGLWMALERLLGWHRPATSFRPLPWIRTIMVVILGWVLFRADSLAAAGHLYLAMGRMDLAGYSDAYASQINRFQVCVLVIGWAIMLGGGLLHRLRRWQPSDTVGLQWLRYPAMIGMVPLFLLAVLKLAAESYSPFLYFQF